MNLCIDMWSATQVPIREFEQETPGFIIFIVNSHTLIACRRADFYTGPTRIEGSYVSPARAEGSYVIAPRHGARRCYPL